MRFKLSNKERRELRERLYKRYGRKCHYCGIEEDAFPVAWRLKETPFYGLPYRGYTLEIDHKDYKQGHSIDNCVLACALCNMAKSDMFEYDEFKKVGEVIKEIWQKRVDG